MICHRGDVTEEKRIVGMGKCGGRVSEESLGGLLISQRKGLPPTQTLKPLAIEMKYYQSLAIGRREYNNCQRWESAITAITIEHHDSDTKFQGHVYCLVKIIHSCCNIVAHSVAHIASFYATLPRITILFMNINHDVIHVCHINTPFCLWYY